MRRIFVFEARVDVADEICSAAPVSQLAFAITQKYEKGKGRKEQTRTIVVVVANDHLLRLAVLAHLAPKVLVEGVEVVLQLARVHLVFRIVGRVLVQVGEEDRLRVGGLDVLAAAAVAVPAGADLVVEGAVHFILLRAEDGGEVAGWAC